MVTCQRKYHRYRIFCFQHFQIIRLYPITFLFSIIQWHNTNYFSHHFLPLKYILLQALVNEQAIHPLLPGILKFQINNFLAKSSTTAFDTPFGITSNTLDKITPSNEFSFNCFTVWSPTFYKSCCFISNQSN